MFRGFRFGILLVIASLAVHAEVLKLQDFKNRDDLKKMWSGFKFPDNSGYVRGFKKGVRRNVCQ